MLHVVTIPQTTPPQDAPVQSNPPVPILLIRTIMLGSIFFLSFVWSILLCVAIFVQWVNMNIVERNMISMMLFIECLTIILIPLLLAREFRLWLDAARSLFVFASHFGIAVWFACKVPSMKCAEGDGRAVCTSLIFSILIFSWVIPILVTLYSCSLGYHFYRLSKLRRLTPMTPTTPTATPSTMPSAKSNMEKRQTMASHGSFYTSWNVSRASSGYVV